MLSDKSVNFAWDAYPSAKIIHSSELVTKFVAMPGTAPPGPRRFFDLAAAGKPRPRSATTTQGFWRDFVEAMDRNDAAQVEAFVQVYGDPCNALITGGETSSTDWFNLYIVLAYVARAWGPEDAAGVSRVDNQSGIAEAEAWLRFAGLKYLAALVNVVPALSGEPDLLLAPSTLGGFMLLSAIGGFRRRVPMRRCRTCRSWYELRRTDNLYCSNACRIAHSVANKPRKG